MRRLSLGIVLFIFWLALSGHYTPMLIGFGIATVVLAVVVTIMMNGVDEEAHPYHLILPALTYYPWLVREIVKSAWNVSGIIVNPRLPISPTMTVVEASQVTPNGIATYGNSITLTPGTITTGVNGNRLTVHALSRDGALDLEEGVMDARVKRFEGGA
ncbi:MAG: Na+/H+ antiporter subunit E [Rhizobiaceae bacterium]